MSAGPATAQEQAPIDLPGVLFNSLHSDSEAKVLDWLRKGGDPDTVIDDDGNTVTHYAATNLLGILREAARRGGDCNRQNAYGATPLHFAASQQPLGPGADAVRALVSCEAAPDVRRACAGQGEGRDDARCRADPDARDRRGNAPLHALYDGVEKQSASLIRNLGTTVGGAGMRGDILRALLQEVGADPNIRNNNGDAPLMLLIRATRKPALSAPEEHASFLLRHGADPDTRNNRGATPLIEAVSLDVNAIDAGDDPARVITALLRHGADPDLRAGNGDTPLIRAAKHEDDSVFELEALLAGGADPCLRDRGGRLAYDHTDEGSDGRLLLYKAGGYTDPDTGLCARGLLEVKEREQQLGLDGETRQQIRSCLKAAGFDPGAGDGPAADGEFAPGTRAAARAWQQAQGREGLEAAGYFSKADADALLEACRAAGSEQMALERELAGEMVTIPGGAFRLGKYEVTFAQWDACVAAGGCDGYSPDDKGWGRGDRPVIFVSWDDVQSFITWLNGRTGGGYRLPTEAEWEYAARAGSTTKYSWGDDIGRNRANCDNDVCGDSYEYTAPVGSFPANAWGLHDMHGNVWEWVQDCWGDDCGRRVRRGGSWYNFARFLRSAYRNGLSRTYRLNFIGFRLAQDL